jgi:Arc/MetJ-type ribon-helix-helix transcriptional regulator
MKISASLPDEDLTFLDAYVVEQGLPSRSAALHKAIRLLKAHGLGSAYEAAWSEWQGEDAGGWSSAVSDGLS